MCQAYFTLYPCNHAVLTYWEPCIPKAHPSNCNPQDLAIYLTPFTTDDTELPSACPASKLGRTCTAIDPHPKRFAEYCISNKIAIEDAIAMAPAWLYDLQGNKIGTRTWPWRLSDYVVALGLAKNPQALQYRNLSKKRKANEGPLAPTKKPKVELSKSSEANKGSENSSSASKTSCKGAGLRVAMKVES